MVPIFLGEKWMRTVQCTVLNHKNAKKLCLSPSNSVLDQDDLSRIFLDMFTNDIKEGSKPSILVSETSSSKILNDKSTHQWSMFGREGTIQ